MLQMAMPGIASVADAWRAQDMRDVTPIHVEAHSEQHCVPVHPEICALCAFAANCVPQLDVPAPAHVLRTAGTMALASDEREYRAIASVTARPRGPPLT